MSAERLRPWLNPTPCHHLEPDIAGQFDTFEDWVNHATRCLTGKPYSTGSLGRYGDGMPAMCIDNIGRRCAIGADFHRARDQGTFPIRYFWEFKPRPSTHQALAAITPPEPAPSDSEACRSDIPRASSRDLIR